MSKSAACQSGELREFVRQCLWARDLLPAQLPLILDSLVPRRFGKGEFVCRKGEMADSWMGVMSGLVKSTNVSVDGKSVTLTGVPAGGWFGEGSLLKNEKRPYGVVALRESVVVFMPKRTFDELLRNNIGFNHFLLTQLNQRLGQFIAMLESERLFDPEVRLARALAQLFNPHLYPNRGNGLAITQEEIGLLCGLSRPRANKALKQLEDLGLLKVEYGSISVPDLGRLGSYGD